MGIRAAIYTPNEADVTVCYCREKCTYHCLCEQRTELADYPPGMVITDENGKKSLTFMISLTRRDPSRLCSPREHGWTISPW